MEIPRQSPRPKAKAANLDTLLMLDIVDDPSAPEEFVDSAGVMSPTTETARKNLQEAGYIFCQMSSDVLR